MRRQLSRAAKAARRQRVVSISVAVALITSSGCAMLGRRHRDTEGVAASRELSRQGVAALEMGHWQQAEDLLKKSLDESPDDAATHRYMAEALWHRGEAQAALSQMAEATHAEPANASLAVRAGEMSLGAGMLEVALAHAERAIRLDPKLAGAWALRGRCFQRLNQPDRALADLERALEFAPDRSDVLLDVAVIYRQRGQAARCLTTVHCLLDTYRPGDEPQNVLLLEGLSLLDLGRAQQASAALAAAVQHGPPSADAYFYLAQSYSASDRVAEATAAAQQALAINSSHQASAQLLAQLAAGTKPGETQRR